MVKAKKLIFVLILITFFFTGCKKEEEKPIRAIPASQGVVENTTESSSNKETENVKIETDAGVPAKKQEKRLTPLSKIDTPKKADFLLYPLQVQKEILFCDFKIDELQNENELTLEREIEIFEITEKFLQDLLEKQLESELIFEEKYQFLRNNYDRWFSNIEVIQYRIGKLDIMAEPPNVEIRLLTENEYYQGIIYFINNDGWKVFDFHFNSDTKKNDYKKWEPGIRKG